MQIDGRDPERFAHFEYANQTTVHPLGLAALLAAIVWVFASRRRTIVWPVVVLLCFIAPAQRIVIGGLDLPFMRIIVVIALLHAVMSGGAKGLRSCWVDRAMAFLMVWWPLLAVMRGQLSGVAMYVGAAGDMLAAYLLARLVIRELDDILSFFRSLAVVSIPSAALFSVEYFTGRNMFSVFGGVKEITMMRFGELRCQGAFSHPIIAGLWWVASIPLIGSLWWSRRRAAVNGVLAVVGVCCAVFIVWVSNSSTTMTVLFLMPVMVAMFTVRRWFGRLAWLVLAMVAALHVVAQNGFHHLAFTRISATTGGTGYHRYRLYDEAINHLSEWAVIGARSTYNWGWGLDDVTSEVVLSALSGGLIGVVLFVAFIVWGVRASWKATLRLHADPSKQAAAYAVGVAMLGIAVCSLGVGFFGQADFIFPFLLGVIPAVVQLRPSPTLPPSPTRRTLRRSRSSPRGLPA